MATINYNETTLKVYHFYGKDMAEGVYYRKADVDKLIESMKAGDNIGLPYPPKPRRATNRELARWLAQGNGELLVGNRIRDYGFEYEIHECDFPALETWKVRKWEDTEWHEPDVDYMGLEEVK